MRDIVIYLPGGEGGTRKLCPRVVDFNSSHSSHRWGPPRGWALTPILTDRLGFRAGRVFHTTHTVFTVCSVANAFVGNAGIWGGTDVSLEPPDIHIMYIKGTWILYTCFHCIYVLQGLSNDFTSYRNTWNKCADMFFTYVTITSILHTNVRLSLYIRSGKGDMLFTHVFTL